MNDILSDININLETDKSFEYYYNEYDLNAKFIKQKATKNFIYFNCSKKRNGCKGLIKYNKKDKNIIYSINVIKILSTIHQILIYFIMTS